jgi:hypothetical protein
MGVGCGIPWGLERIRVPALKISVPDGPPRGQTAATLAPRQRVYRTEVVEFTHNERGTSLSLHRKSAYIGSMEISDTPKGLARIAFRGMAALLVALISVSPASGQGTGDPAAPSANVRIKGTSRNAPASQARPGTQPSRARNAPKGNKSARISARPDQTGVCGSTELRPMAQQLITLRTLALRRRDRVRTPEPAAAAAAYLSLGHALPQTQMPTRLQHAGATAVKSWPTTRIFWPRRPSMIRK